MAFLNNPEKLKVRQLEVEITLVTGTFNGNSNKKIVNSLTVDATIKKTLNNNFTNTASIVIYGMSNTDIATLSTTGYQPLVYESNKIDVFAQYEGEAKSLAFSGFIVKAYADYSNPSRPMHFECQTSYQNAIDATAPINTAGTQDVAQVFNNIATSIGYSFENTGVSGVLNNCILTGSPIDQLKQLSKQTQTNCVVDLNKVKIAPQGQALSNQILDVNSSSGLLGFPIPDQWGVLFKMRYTPQLQIGQYVKLETNTYIPKSNGQWFAYDIETSLNNRHENWFSTVKGSYNSLQGLDNGA
jgi:hypothetical protein